MKVDLSCVKNIDAKLIKDEFLKAVGIESLQKFMVYGELMCNPGLYDYKNEGVSGTY